MNHWFFQAFTPEFCALCKQEGEVFCSSCRIAWWTSPEFSHPKMLITEHFAVGHYHDLVLQKLLLLWKYHGVAHARDALLGIVQETIVDYFPALTPVEAVAFVPLHWRKKNARGFDQAEELGVAVAKALQVPLLPLIERRRYTEQQARVDREQRSANQFEGVFGPSKRLSTIPDRVLLVDDVWTTGTTISAAAEVLHRLGVTHISALTIAKG